MQKTQVFDFLTSPLVHSIILLLPCILQQTERVPSAKCETELGRISKRIVRKFPECNVIFLSARENVFGGAFYLNTIVGESAKEGKTSSKPYFGIFKSERVVLIQVAFGIYYIAYISIIKQC